MSGLSRRKILRAAAAAGGGLAAGAAGFPFIARRRGENFFLIIADAMRADVIGKVVNGREVTPNINRLASGGLYFRNAYSAAPGTKFSVASILSGMYPPGHGVEHQRFTLPACTTLQGWLSSRGAFTAAVATNPYLAPEIGPESSLAPMGFGFNAGFDCYRQPGPADFARDRRPAGRFARLDAFLDGAEANRLLRTLVERRAPRPGEAALFAWIHYMDSHQPWVKPWPLEGVTGAFHREGSGDVASVHAGDAELVESILFNGLEKESLCDAQLERLKAVYLESCAWADRCIGELLTWLEECGRLEGATVVVTSDHGEEFMEHGCIGHGQNLYNTSLRVPLVITRPGLGARLVEARVSNAQILPTLMDWHGRSLPHTNVPPLDHYISNPGAGDAEIFASFYGRDKVITSEGKEAMDHGGARVQFDLCADPGELSAQPPSPEVETALEKARATSKRLAREAGIKRRFSTYAWQNSDVDAQNAEARTLIAAGKITEMEAALMKSYGRFLPERAACDLTVESAVDPAALSAPRREQLRALGYLN